MVRPRSISVTVDASTPAHLGATRPGQFPHEQAVIAEAERQGEDEFVVLPYNGTPVPFCASCGRIICHPECSRR